MNDPQLQRDLGRVEGRLEAVEDDLVELKRLTQEMHSVITEAKGGWKTMLAIGAASSAITTVMFKLWAALKGL